MESCHVVVVILLPKARQSGEYRVIHDGVAKLLVKEISEWLAERREKFLQSHYGLWMEKHYKIQWKAKLFTCFLKEEKKIGIVFLPQEEMPWTMP